MNGKQLIIGAYVLLFIGFMTACLAKDWGVLSAFVIAGTVLFSVGMSLPEKEP